MINDFEDFCTWMYVVVDDIWRNYAADNATNAG
jgi:hypothetical protein